MQAIVGIGLNAVFLGVIPTIYQICGAMIALLGALSIILSNPPAPKKSWVWDSKWIWVSINIYNIILI